MLWCFFFYRTPWSSKIPSWRCAIGATFEQISHVKCVLAEMIVSRRLWATVPSPVRNANGLEPKCLCVHGNDNCQQLLAVHLLGYLDAIMVNEHQRAITYDGHCFLVNTLSSKFLFFLPYNQNTVISFVDVLLDRGNLRNREGDVGQISLFLNLLNLRSFAPHLPSFQNHLTERFQYVPVHHWGISRCY